MYKLHFLYTLFLSLSFSQRAVSSATRKYAVVFGSDRTPARKEETRLENKKKKVTHMIFFFIEHPNSQLFAKHQSASLLLPRPRPAAESSSFWFEKWSKIWREASLSHGGLQHGERNAAFRLIVRANTTDSSTHYEN